MLALLERFKIGRAALAAAAVVLVFGLGAGTAVAAGGDTQDSGAKLAVVTNSTGSVTDAQYLATNDTAYVVPAATPSGTWENVPGMVRVATVPAGERRIIDVRFTAESQCVDGSWCSVRVVYVVPGGAPVEFFPQSGTDYAFDSPSGSPSDFWEGHALERNTRFFLPAGTYAVYVQAAKIGAVTSFRLDDMHMWVGLIRP